MQSPENAPQSQQNALNQSQQNALNQSQQNTLNQQQNALNQSQQNTLNQPQNALNQSQNEIEDQRLSPLERYIRRCNAKVRDLWDPPKGSKHGVAVIACRLHFDGQVSRVALKESTCEFVVTRTALAAIQDAAPFDPMPDGFPEFVDLELLFEYGVLESGRNPDAIEDPSDGLTPLQRWARQCNARVRAEWNPPTGGDPGNVSISCRVFNDGTISNIKLEKTTCSMAVTQTAFGTLKACSPFTPMPPNSPQFVDLKFNFEYGLLQAMEQKPVEELRSSPAARREDQTFYTWDASREYKTNQTA